MHPRRPYYLFAVFLLPALFLLQKPSITQPIRSVSLSIVKPAVVIGEAVTNAVSNVFTGLSNLWNAFRDQGVLRARLTMLESELLRFEEMERENARLKKLIDFKTTLKGKTIAARVIGWDPAPWKKVVILDRGKNQGVKKNMAVVVPEGLAGYVFDVGLETSQVLLLTDSDSRVSALSDATRTNGIVAGNGSPNLNMTYLDLDSPITVGETILTSGVGGIFPKGIRIGKVTNISRESNGLHLVAKIEPFVHFSKLEEVICTERFLGE